MEQQYVGRDSETSPAASAVDHERLGQRWAASGAAGLSGRPTGSPLPVPAALVRGVIDHAAAIADVSESLGRRVELDGLALLGERAALAGLRRRGDVSCGGATRLLPTVDGWIAVSLARPDDIASMPAWLEVTLPGDLDELWPEIARHVIARSALDLVGRACLLGLPISSANERAGGPRSRSGPATQLQVAESRAADRVGRGRRLDDLLVVDLSSLWAGPLCANLLGLAGCRIVKVESLHRPDGARFGSKDFYDVLHGGHESVIFDFAEPRDLAALRALVEAADVVIEASRPRALAGLGIDRSTVAGPLVWLSIVGHGREGIDGERTAFGDDAAAAGGLLTSDSDGLCFCCDAVADPLTGIVSANEVLDALGRGGRWFIDVALSGVASSMAGGPLVSVEPSGAGQVAARPVVSRAPTSGHDTEAVLAELGIRR